MAGKSVTGSRENTSIVPTTLTSVYQVARDAIPSTSAVVNAGTKVLGAVENAGSSLKSISNMCVDYAYENPTNTAAIVVTGVAVGAATVPLTPYILAGLGFTKTGVVAASAAAKIQSVIYGAYTTGFFSLLQSAGAAGVSTATGAVLAGAGAGTAATVTAVTVRAIEPNTGLKIASGIGYGVISSATLGYPHVAWIWLPPNTHRSPNFPLSPIIGPVLVQFPSINEPVRKLATTINLYPRVTTMPKNWFSTKEGSLLVVFRPQMAKL